MKRDREKEIRLKLEEYRKKLAKMNKAQFAAEWNRVMLQLNPNSQVKDCESRI